MPVEPKDMRFYCTSLEAEPVGPKANPRLRGRPRRSYSLRDAAQETGWPTTALVALHRATYPDDGGQDDPRLFDLAEAMYDPAVRKPLLFFYSRCGSLPPPSIFLRCLLIGWDMNDAACKAETIIEALDVTTFDARSWFNAEAAREEEARARAAVGEAKEGGGHA